MQEQALADQILDTALRMAEASSWERLHLYAVAEKLHITLEQIRKIYPQKDDIVEAWFDRADRALLDRQPSDEFLRLSDYKRLRDVMLTWFDTLAPYRRVTRQMLGYKLEFGHVHLQILGLMRISRTVQWFREASRIDSTDLRRILEESVTTAIFLMGFTHWLYDDTVGSRKTRDFLEKALTRVERHSGLLSIL